MNQTNKKSGKEVKRERAQVHKWSPVDEQQCASRSVHSNGAKGKAEVKQR